tara:strand:+ start:268 stop:1707 length:1440 start_codon:yes stop_codon:yes gene_type:complete
MPKLQITTLSLIIASISFFLTIGCESPQQSTAKPKNHTTTLQPHVIEVMTDKNEVDQLKQRIVETYIRYWPLISSEHQREQLPRVLGDQMEELRIFGIERVGVLLRDGESTEEELQLVVDRLTDDSPAVRLAAATLLPEINVLGLAEHIANALAHEQNLEVVEQELIYFQTNSHPNAIKPTIDRLQQNPSGAAGDTLIFLLSNNVVTQEIQSQILQIVLKSRQNNTLPALITLKAMLGSKTTKQHLVKLLDNPDESVSESVAKGFAYAGFTGPLIERADNELIYPYALSALQKKIDIESFKKLLELRKDNEPNWNAAAFSIASSLGTSELLRADDMLNRIELDDLRLSILSNVWKNASEKSLAARKAIAKRTVPLMIIQGDAVGALQLLDIFGESLIDEELITLRFAAAINASAWDAAEDARPEPSLWIAEWERVKEFDPNAASVMKKQITQRFSDQITKEQMLVLDIIPTIKTTEETP